MTIDFHEEYKHYSNIELLWIVQQPDEYQPEAVAAATKILGQREVTDEEVYESEKFGRIKARTAELFPPVFQPHDKIEPSKWLNFLLLVIAIEYVWILYGATKELVHIFSHQYIWWGQFIDLVSVVYIPIIFFLLFKRRRWGWILLFVDNLGTMVLLMSELPYFFKYVAPHHGEIVPYFSWILLRAVFAVFLWREMITGLFGVDTTTKKWTLGVAIALPFLLSGILYLL